MNLATIQVFFAYNDWAQERLMSFVEPLDDEKLDRSFEMGMDSLRETMGHLYSVEWVWLERWKGHSPAVDKIPNEFPEMKDLHHMWRITADERNIFIEALSDADLDQLVTYTNAKSEEWSFKLGHILMHVCSHGTHHRAQVLNMLRHVGVRPPEMDFLRMFES